MLPPRLRLQVQRLKGQKEGNFKEQQCLGFRGLGSRSFFLGAQKDKEGLRGAWQKGPDGEAAAFFRGAVLGRSRGNRGRAALQNGMALDLSQENPREGSIRLHLGQGRSSPR